MLIPDFTLEKVIHKSESTTAVQSNSYMSLACYVSSGFTSFLNWKNQTKTKPTNPKQRKSPKENRTKACGNNSLNNHSGLALVARRDSCEFLQSSRREVEAGEGMRKRSGGDSTHGLQRPATPYAFQPSLPLVRGGPKLFSPSHWILPGSDQRADQEMRVTKIQNKS